MTKYKGVIIEESLENKDILKKVKIISTRVEKVTDEHQTPWLSQWTLHTVEIEPEKVDKIAKLLGKNLEREHEWYADFKNENCHYIIYRDKVFRIDRKSKAQYDKARKYGLSLGIPKYQLISYPGVALDTLAHFLNQANKNTYANVKAKKAPSTRPGSEDYHFEQGDLVYHDTYFGGRDFIGEEIIYDTGRPIWGANYYGFVLDDKVDEEKLYDFLRKALMQEYSDVIPVRGPGKFVEKEWEYRFSATGDLSNFIGKEEISRSEKVVYRLYIHGGFIG